jgi:hypothetical protein
MARLSTDAAPGAGLEVESHRLTQSALEESQ